MTYLITISPDELQHAHMSLWIDTRPTLFVGPKKALAIAAPEIRICPLAPQLPLIV